MGPASQTISVETIWVVHKRKTQKVPIRCNKFLCLTHISLLTRRVYCGSENFGMNFSFLFSTRCIPLCVRVSIMVTESW